MAKQRIEELLDLCIQLKAKDDPLSKRCLAVLEQDLKASYDRSLATGRPRKKKVEDHAKTVRGIRERKRTRIHELVAKYLQL